MIIAQVVTIRVAIFKLSTRKQYTKLRYMATASVAKEVLPPVVDPKSEPPVIFDGTTRLYISYVCPYAQRAWITRNYKGLQSQIKLVPVDLLNIPAWFKEKVYPPNKVPALEHNNKIIGESLDVVKYIDENFEGPSLIPTDPEMVEAAEEWLAYIDSFNTIMHAGLSPAEEIGAEVVAALDQLEDALSKFDDGPFFLGQFSHVDIAYAPFLQRFKAFYPELKNYDILKERPKLTLWFEELSKIDGYAQTIRDPQELLPIIKKRFGIP